MNSLYLHPNHFTPDPSRVPLFSDPSYKKFILRFSDLGAYHDVGMTGMTDDVAMRIIQRLEKKDVFSSPLNVRFLTI